MPKKLYILNTLSQVLAGLAFAVFAFSFHELSENPVPFFLILGCWAATTVLTAANVLVFAK